MNADYNTALNIGNRIQLNPVNPVEYLLYNYINTDKIIYF